MQINKPVSIIIIFIITLLVAFLFAAPKYQESVDAQNNLGAKQAELSGKADYYAKISALVQDVQSRSDALEKMNNALPNTFSFSPLQYFFQTSAKQHDLAIKSVVFSQVSGAQPGGSIKEVGFMIVISGTYENFKKLLALLDSSARLFEINSISFNSPQATGLPVIKSATKTAPIYDFTMQMVTHTY